MTLSTPTAGSHNDHLVVSPASGGQHSRGTRRLRIRPPKAQSSGHIDEGLPRSAAFSRPHGEDDV
jgi:hypothetical protein